MKTTVFLSVQRLGTSEVHRRLPRWRSGPALIRGFVLLFLFGACSLNTVAASSRPNILLILADDMGFSDLGCYGGDIRTPNLNALAEDGLRFTQFYNTARCWPTRAAVLTGYYAQSVRRDTVPGVQSGGRGVRPRWAKLLPEMLHTVGYRCYQSGKWHIDGEPVENGFDHSYVLNDHNRNFSPQNLTEDGHRLPPVERGTGYYTTTAFADHAIKCLKEHAANHPDQPFFEYLAFTVPHFPLQAPAEDIARYRGTYRDGWDAVRRRRYERELKLGIVHTSLSALEPDVGPPYSFPEDIAKLGPNEVNRPIPWNELTPDQQEFQATKMSIHAAMVDRMDQEIGRVIAQIKAMGAFENTLILFLSDNGASAEMMVRGDGHDPEAPPGSAASFLCLGPGFSSAANTPFRRHKVWVHEGGISTPLIVHWPSGIKSRGELRRNPGHVIDLVPTILEVTGAKPFKTVDGMNVPPAPGKSLVPAFAHDGAVKHDSIWWQHEGNRALRIGDMKIVAAGANAPWELYDLSTDRAESHDLASARPEMVRAMAAEWSKNTVELRRLAHTDLPEKPRSPRREPAAAPSDKTPRSAGPKVGDRAPLLHAIFGDGDTAVASQTWKFAGHDTLLVFWDLGDTNDVRLLEEVRESVTHEGPRLQVVAVASSTDRQEWNGTRDVWEPWIEFLRAHRDLAVASDVMTQVLEAELFDGTVFPRDSNGLTSSGRYGVRELPSLFLIGPDERLLATHIPPEKVDELVQKAR